MKLSCTVILLVLCRQLDGANGYEKFQNYDHLALAVDDYLDNGGELNAESLQTYGPIEEWDVSQIDYFYRLFNVERNANASSFNADLSQWNLESATDLHDMFLGAELFDTNVSQWNVSRVQQFHGMFNGAKSFTGIGLENWDVSNGETFTVMFLDCKSLGNGTFDLRGWNVSNARQIESMFKYSTFGLDPKTRNLCAWKDVLDPSVSTDGMFDGTPCPYANALDLQNITSFCTACTAPTPTSSPVPTIIFPTKFPTYSPIHYNFSDAAPIATSYESPPPHVIDGISIAPSVDPVSNSHDSSKPTSVPAESPNQVPTPNETPSDPTTVPSTIPASDLELGPTFYQQSSNASKPNVLLIVTDQQRFDTLSRVQNEKPEYDGTLKVRTPNLDSLSKRGVWFENAYCQMSVCGPARAALRTGCTVGRTGVFSNVLTEEAGYMKSPVFQSKVESAVTIDNVMVEKLGYSSKYFGKWHLPPRWYKFENQSGPAVTYNNFNYQEDKFEFTERSDGQNLKLMLEYFKEQGMISPELGDGEQLDTFTGLPYKPIAQLDTRYDASEQYHTGLAQTEILGNSSFSEMYTPSRFNGEVPVKALEQLVQEDRPWFMTVNFHSPHPPWVPAWKYLEYYWEQRDQLYVSPSITDPWQNTPYSAGAGIFEDRGFKDPIKIKEWTALYYALVEEVDDWVGMIVDTLGERIDDTLIIFTSDHGEHLGSHGREGKNTFYEEASRSPLFMVYPKKIPAGIRVNDFVSHLDIFATILDYAGGSELDQSDGTSLRPLVEGKNFNELYDENVTVTEWDPRRWDDDKGTTSSYWPTLMVRKGSYKLMMHRDAEYEGLDMLLNLDEDPHELNNLVGERDFEASEEVVSKAEHLRCLLLEWMERMDGAEKYFSDPFHNFGIGEGTMAEVRKRQWWTALDFWVGDSEISFGPTVYHNEMERHIRNEYLYMGTRNLAMDQGDTVVNLVLEGDDTDFFSLETSQLALSEPNQCLRIKISFQPKAVDSSTHPDQTAKTTLRIQGSGISNRSVQLTAMIPDPLLSFVEHSAAVDESELDGLSSTQESLFSELGLDADFYLP